MKILEVITKLPDIVYHGTSEPLEGELRNAPQGLYFTPHIGHAKIYGNLIYACTVYAERVYLIDYDEDIDEDIIDALFDMEYNEVAKYIQILKAKGYQAMQTVTDSEMIIAFDNAKIVNHGLVNEDPNDI